MIAEDKNITYKEAADIVRRIRYYMEGGELWTDAEFWAMDKAISALEGKEMAEKMYQMACEEIDKNRETTPYKLGRLSALADVTGHVAQAFSPD